MLEFRSNSLRAAVLSPVRTRMWTPREFNSRLIRLQGRYPYGVRVFDFPDDISIHRDRRRHQCRLSPFTICRIRTLRFKGGIARDFVPIDSSADSRSRNRLEVVDRLHRPSVEGRAPWTMARARGCSLVCLNGPPHTTGRRSHYGLSTDESPSTVGCSSVKVPVLSMKMRFDLSKLFQ